MKTIVFYINKIADGGAERAIVNLATELSERGYTALLVTSFRTEDEYAIGEKVERISLEDEQVIQSSMMRNLSRIKKLRDICKKRKPEILISFMAEPIVRSQIATLGLPIKNVASVRSDPKRVYPGIKGMLLGKILLPLVDGCVFQTRDAQEFFPIRLQKKSRIIYNPVTSEFYEKKRAPVKNKVITCGRLSAVKNHKMLIEAFVKVLEIVPDAQLDIYGIGELRNDLQQIIEQMGLSCKIHLMGNTTNVADTLTKADLFVLSSNQEGLPNALMEAMAVGVPSISTDCPCGGPRELFGDELKDMLVPVGDSMALADKMIELLTNDEQRLRVGRQMIEQAELFRANVIVDQWVEYLEYILNKAPV